MTTIYYEPTGCNCDGTDYTNDDINGAATQALQLASQGQTTGRDRYPHAYNDYEHFTFAHASAPYLEFPIFQNGKVYDGGSPGPDRIVIGSISEDFSSAVYCAVVTHDGQRRNGFAECSDDTMNVRGKGSFKTVEKEEGIHEKGARFGRKLIQRIDL